MQGCGLNVHSNAGAISEKPQEANLDNGMRVLCVRMDVCVVQCHSLVNTNSSKRAWCSVVVFQVIYKKGPLSVTLSCCVMLAWLFHVLLNAYV